MFAGSRGARKKSAKLSDQICRHGRLSFAGVPQEAAHYGMLVGSRSAYSRPLLQPGLKAHQLNSALSLLEADGSGAEAKNIFLFHRFPEDSNRFRSCGRGVGRGIDEPLRDSHDGPESDAWE
jgi:hypothetical protein